MSKLGILGAAALSLMLAAAAPVFAQGRGGHVGGGGGMHVGGMGGGMHMGSAGFRGAQASIGAGRFTQGAFNGGYRGQDGWRHRGFRPGVGFVVGSALGYGYGPYYDSYYGDDYAYDDYYDSGYPAAGVVVSGGVDPAYCAQRYRSYDPASGTYLGYDGLRHPCGQ
jgi:hypothetical protein